ncbi:MAG: aminopeptidase N [Magnetococcales bacterium]|nr:aminopeptidase N [Magnetococcales bacterium]
MSGKPKEIVYLKDYRPPAFSVESVQLHFKLDPDRTVVASEMVLIKNPGIGGESASADLRLDGRHLQLLEARMNGEPLATGSYSLDEEGMTVHGVGDRCTLALTTCVHPRTNTSLEGLFCSKDILCTQCEPEGLRKITYFPDRPDVMTRYRVILEADEGRYNALLSNGNLVSSVLTQDGKRVVTWDDPYKKPSYLFALVAGNLYCATGGFTTASGREITLHVYVEPENSDKCQHALMALTKAMAWDERRFGREYDLDLYQIVAVNDFNMGAMENKGLNLFNAKYVLAQPQTATDLDYQQIESVIAHEYFHNWTGNRITCRDWFQLSLKEGLTVYRDQEFSADEVTTKAIGRIEAVRTLRSLQFPEDAGPTAHPVRPDSYMEINNFYTMTIYNKGAEVVRMLATLLGTDGFRRGMDDYFSRFDGQAVTVEDFLTAMSSGSGRDLRPFLLWYQQSGTPVVTLQYDYDAKQQTCTLTFQQNCPPTPGQPSKKPFPIPIIVALLDNNGREIPLHLDGSESGPTTRLLELVAEKQTFTFSRVPRRPVPSVLRHFSAPVRLHSNLSNEEMGFLWCHDGDGFNRWEGGQAFASKLLLNAIEHWQRGENFIVPEAYLEGFKKNVQDPALQPMDKAMLLMLPDEKYLLDQMPRGEPEGVYVVRRRFKKRLAHNFAEYLLELYQTLAEKDKSYQYDRQAVGRRTLKNYCLDYLVTGDCQRFGNLAVTQYETTDNMTDRLLALVKLAHEEHPRAQDILDDFQKRWKNDPLVMDKWFSIQATSPALKTLERVKLLLHHTQFSMSNPNKVRALIGAFCHTNPYRFHAGSGEGYRFLVTIIESLNGINPQVAARMLTPLLPWKRFEEQRGRLMLESLRTIAAIPDLARDIHELVHKALAD